ncbi:hypothetical protein RRV45_10695 [Bacillus sp. DTU_2020_1000418_1_SI_GHA_SEK_038]|uniref:hypothetical protein n=1 Tax=Bacillus sp. DTU_2020_1000418_1_SI_GHA_SEK_038 TaxID=3077585 RepID=UPI0028EFD8EF|nr:hypothetical protein [Bacillus sp. DTU_2020_1000418_1_SI_GHA_SEK_038]WNS77422.1 hypothetical protein RRV45_10695 [Bacillus sp. DTU_2020_1000418_1_SI_GHA_SEK_038]
MGVPKKTTEFLLLLSGVANKDQSELMDIYYKRIQETAEYRLLESLHDYIFISSISKELHDKLMKIQWKKKTLPEMQTEFATLCNLYSSFHELKNTSRQRMNNNKYDIHLISKNDLEALKQINQDLYYKIRILKNKTGLLPVDAFRNFLKKNNHKGIIDEYVNLRTRDMALRDDMRAIFMRRFGTVMGALVFFALMLYLKPVGIQVEWGIIGTGALLFLLGVANIRQSMRLFSIFLLLTYSSGFIILALVQDFFHLPTGFNFTQLREVNLLLLSSLFGGFLGFILGDKLNYIPAQAYRPHQFFRFVERGMRFLTIALLAFGTLWTFAFKADANIFPFIQVKMEQHLAAKIEALSTDKEKVAEEKTSTEDEEKVEAIGTVIVVAKSGAHVRTEPLISKSTERTTVAHNTILSYYEVKIVDGVTWYYILEPKSQEMLWIHGSTVKE